MSLIELRQKILLIRLAGQTLVIKWKSDERKGISCQNSFADNFLSGISLANYINGSQIHSCSSSLYARIGKTD